MNNQKILSLIGLAAKAGKVVSGEFTVEKALKQQRAFLVLIAEDASANTKKKFRDMSTYRRIPIYFLYDKSRLGHAVGKEYRASLAITDRNFAGAIQKHLDDNQEGSVESCQE